MLYRVLKNRLRSTRLEPLPVFKSVSHSLELLKNRVAPPYFLYEEEDGLCVRCRFDLMRFNVSYDKKFICFSASTLLPFGVEGRTQSHWKHLTGAHEYCRLSERAKKQSAQLEFVTPPWVEYPGYPPYDGVWRQPGEYYLHLVWHPFWDAKSAVTKKQYLQDNPPPAEWKEWLDK